MSEPFVPLSVRRGLRDPLPYSEGVPEHIRQQAISWVSKLVRGSSFNIDVSTMVAQLQIPELRQGGLEDRVITFCTYDDDTFLEVLDYLLHTRTTTHRPLGEYSVFEDEHAFSRADKDPAVQELSNLLEAGRSCWTVGWVETSGEGPFGSSTRRYCLERRVAEGTEQEYLQARGIGGKAGEKLTEAWHAAFGRAEDAEQCWKASVTAVEAALQPVVSPNNSGARLGTMRNGIKAAPHKWECDLPVWGDEGITSVEAFLNVLNRITYDNGRHGGDDRVPEMREARAVLMVAVTVVEWVRDGVFRPAGEA